jgi:hypothetical protein
VELIILVVRRLKQEDSEFEARLSYVVRSCQKKKKKSQAPVAHIYNPSYSRGRNQEDCGSKPAQVNSWRETHLKKKPITKRANGVAQGEVPEFKLQY